MTDQLNCDPDFNWKKYIKFDLFTINGSEKAEIKDALDFIASTPEGQLVIEQARERYGKKLVITNWESLDTVNGEGSNIYGMRFAYLNVNFDQLENIEYAIKDRQGEYAQVSLIHAIYHELFHIADINGDEQNLESRAVDSTNVFLSKYLPNEPLRGKYDDSREIHDNYYIHPPTEVPTMCEATEIDYNAVPAGSRGGDVSIPRK